MDAKTITIIALSIFVVYFVGLQILTSDLRKLKEGQLENLEKLCDKQQEFIESQKRTIEKLTALNQKNLS